MKYLLDTQAFLWFALDDPRLTTKARLLIEDLANQILVSPASYWEIAIKMSVGKYSLSIPHDTFFENAFSDHNFTILHIFPKHTNKLLTLPHHHEDPFDRLIISQALYEGLETISSDTAFDLYPIQRIWS